MKHRHQTHAIILRNTIKQRSLITDSNISEALILQTRADYPLFAEYCALLDKGLRKEALKNLDCFLLETDTWDSFKKSNFCKAIFDFADTNKFSINFLLTTNLRTQLISPALLNIIDQEPNNYLALKWYGYYFKDIASLKKAYQLQPQDKDLSLTLLNALETALWLSLHHLPDAYLGSIQEDESDLELAFVLLRYLEIKETDQLYAKIAAFYNEFSAYKQKQESPNNS